TMNNFSQSQSQSLYLQALKLSRESGDSLTTAAALLGLISCSSAIGDIDKGTAYLREVTVIAAALNNKLLEGIIMCRKGIFYYVQGNYPQMLNAFDSGLFIYRKYGFRAQEANGLS